MIRAALAAVLAAATLTVPAPASTTTAATTYTVTTINVRHTLGKTRARHDLDLAQRGSDLVLTQEMGSRRASSFTRPGWRVSQPGDVMSLAVFYRPAVLRLVGSFPVLLHRSHAFASATRYALAYRFAPAGGGCLLVVDVHEIPHVERGGHPRHLPRIALYNRGMDRLTGYTRTARASCALLIGGDWNVDGNADARVRHPAFPYAHLHPAGLRSEWRAFPNARPTLGRRHVDGFYYSGIRGVSRRILGRTYSDHNADRLTFRIIR
jgi:endonuclease/exonuclease/phosphatase (EEP) superfamily protein YafD